MGRRKDGPAIKQRGALGRANVNTSMPSTRGRGRKANEEVAKRG